MDDLLNETFNFHAIDHRFKRDLAELLIWGECGVTFRHLVMTRDNYRICVLDIALLLDLPVPAIAKCTDEPVILEFPHGEGLSRPRDPTRDDTGVPSDVGLVAASQENPGTGSE